MAIGPNSTEARHLRTLFSVGAAGMLTDGQLLERFASRDGDPSELAFAALVERHGPMVLRVARAVLLDEHSAHDVFQATFLILARKARSLWVRDSLGPWLHAVAYRVASQSRSLEGRRRHHERNASRIEAFDCREWDRVDLARAIHEEIDRLPRPHRLAVVACHLEGLTQHEAAHRLGWPVGTLQSRLARGRRRLRDRLRRRGFAPSIAALAGKLTPVPTALTASTARAAATLQLGGPTAGMIAPAVLAMIETTTKGMLMTKLKLGALSLAMIGGLVGSGLGLGVGRPARAIDGPSQSPEAETSRADQPQDSEPRLVVPQPYTPPGIGPKIPVLLNFHAYTKGEPGLSMKAAIESLIEQGYPIRSIDVDKSPALRDRYKVTMLPAHIVVDGSGNELVRLEGIAPAGQLAGLYNDVVARQEALSPGRAMSRVESPDPQKAGGPGAGKAEPREPSLSVPVVPRPWETVVRVKFPAEGKPTRFSSGTVIDGTSNRTIILTGAHNFSQEQVKYSQEKGSYQGEILVDLFDGRLQGTKSATVRPSTANLLGYLLAIDFDLDLALVEIHPGRELPASPIPDHLWEPRRGMTLISLGCSNGGDASAWSTTILDPDVRLFASGSRKMINLIECAHEPKPGRSGGGLFTTDGYLIGVCNFADPDKHAGLYARPESIRKMLDRIGLTRIYENVRPGTLDVVNGRPIDEPANVNEEPALNPVANPRASDQGRRLDDLERKLDRVLQALNDLKGARAPELPKGDFSTLKR